MHNLARAVLVIGISTLLTSTPLKSQMHLTLGLRGASFFPDTHFGLSYTFCRSGSLWLQTSLEVREYGTHSIMPDYYDPMLCWNPCRPFYNNCISPITHHSQALTLRTWWRPWSYHAPRIYLANHSNSWASHWPYDPWVYYPDTYYPSHPPFAHLALYSYAVGSAPFSTPGSNFQLNGTGYKEAPSDRSLRKAVRRQTGRMSLPAPSRPGTRNRAKGVESQEPERLLQRSLPRTVHESRPSPTTLSSPSITRLSQPRARTLPSRNPPSHDGNADLGSQPRAAPRSNPRAAPRSNPRAGRAGLRRENRPS